MHHETRLPGWFAALFVTVMLALCALIAFCTVEQYDLQQRVIELMKGEIEGNDLTTQKMYIAGAKNDYAAPLVKELPKHADAANRTASVILDIIVKLGREPEEVAGGFDVE